MFIYTYTRMHTNLLVNEMLEQWKKTTYSSLKRTNLCLWFKDILNFDINYPNHRNVLSILFNECAMRIYNCI